jgi:hypothetical protein
MYYTCFGLIHLHHRESMWGETPCQLSQRGVRLHINQVNWVDAKGTNIYKDFILSRWFSWGGVSFHVYSVDVESHLVLTQLKENKIPRQLSHRKIFKNLNRSANQEKNLKHPKALLFGLYMFDQYKNQNKKSHTNVPLNPPMQLLPHND